MKKIWTLLLVITLIAGLFTGCGKSQTEIQDEFLEMIKKPATEESISQVSDYLDQYLSKIEEHTASHMIIEFEDYIISYDNQGIQYDEWANKYKEQISPVLAELYMMKSHEQLNPSSKDTVLQISWSELVDRAYKLEQLISANKTDDLIKEDAAWIYGNYINSIVMGTNGTPIFDYKTHEFSQDARDSYSIFVNKYPDSTITWVLMEYFTYLDSIEYSMDYNDKVSSKLFFDTCTWLVSEAGKRVFQ